MLKKIIRAGLISVVVLGYTVPSSHAFQEPPKKEEQSKSKKRTDKGKGKSQKRKAEQPKAQ